MEKSVCPPGRSLSWRVCLAFLLAIFTQNALPSDLSDLVSPNGRFRIELHSEEASPEYLEIHDNTGDQVIRVNKIHFPLLGELQNVRLLWSKDSRFFVLSDTSDHGVIGYIVAFDKDQSNAGVTSLSAGLQGSEIQSFSLDEKNRIVLELHSARKGNFQSVLEVMNDGRIHGNVK